jgi:hypothetical protein
MEGNPKRKTRNLKAQGTIKWGMKPRRELRGCQRIERGKYESLVGKRVGNTSPGAVTKEIEEHEPQEKWETRVPEERGTRAPKACPKKRGRPIA